MLMLYNKQTLSINLKLAKEKIEQSTDELAVTADDEVVGVDGAESLSF